MDTETMEVIVYGHKLTTRQQEALDEIASWKSPHGCDTLACKLGTHPNGASQTASSLVRKGLVVRTREHGLVRYSLAERQR